MAVNKSLVFTITAKDGDVLKAFGRVGKAATKEMKAASDAMEDTRTAGKKMADALSAVADDLDAEFRGMESASSKLASSLGEDFDKGEAAVRGFVQDLRRSGLTFEEIEADADALAAAIRQLDDVSLNKVAGETKQLDTAVTQLGDTTDKTRSVAANFTGNLAQEIPGVTAAMGPLNVAVGQFAEYAAEGDIKIRNLVQAIGPMAGAAGVVMVVQHGLSQMSKASKAAEENVQALADRMREGATRARALADEIRETGEVQIATLNMMGGSGNKDFTEALVNAGLTFQTFNQIAAGGMPAITAWMDAQRAAGNEVSVLDSAVQALIIKSGELDAAERKLAVTNQFMGDSMSPLERKFNDVGDAVTAALLGIGGAAADGAAEVEASLIKIEAAWDRLLGKIDNEQAMADLEVAFEEVEAAGVAAFDAAVQGADDAIAKQREYENGLRDLQRKLAEIAMEIENLPEEQVTKIQAYIDQGKLAHAKAVLDALSHDRQVTYWATVRTRTNQSGPDGGRAAGGPVSAGRMYEVNEHGPELLTTGGRQFLMMGPDSGHVTPISSPGAPAYTGNAGGGGDTIVFNFPNYVGSRDDLIDWVHDGLLVKDRRNGGLGFSS